MKDLTFFNDGNKTRLDGGLINVDKLRKMAERATEIAHLAQVPYADVKEDAVLQNYLAHPKVLPAERLQELSELLEPRESAQ